MRLLTTLYVSDHRARIGVQARSILVRRGDGRRERVPLESLDAIVLVGNGQISSQAMGLSAERGITVTGLSLSGRVRFQSGGGFSGSVLLRHRHHQLADDRDAALSIARIIVAAKLVNTQRLMSRWIADAPVAVRRAIRRLSQQVRAEGDRVREIASADGARGCEGNGARAYFEAVRLHLQATGVELSFDARSRRPPRDPVNAALSYCYGLVQGEIGGAVSAVGLDPQIGFLHGPRPGRPALALDILEEFRVAVCDRFILGLITRRSLAAQHFVTTHGGGCYLSDDGRRQLLEEWEAYRSVEVTHPLLRQTMPRAALALTQATVMARFIRGDLPAYAPLVLPA